MPITNDIFIEITTFVVMNTDSLRFKKYLKFRVEPKRCPTHNKSAHISVTRMEYKIINCCCSEFESFLSDLCEKYRVGILLGKYKNTPKKRLRPPRQNHLQNVFPIILVISVLLHQKTYIFEKTNAENNNLGISYFYFYSYCIRLGLYIITIRYTFLMISLSKK